MCRTSQHVHSQSKRVRSHAWLIHVCKAFVLFTLSAHPPERPHRNSSRNARPGGQPPPPAASPRPRPSQDSPPPPRSTPRSPPGSAPSASSRQRRSTCARADALGAWRPPSSHDLAAEKSSSGSARGTALLRKIVASASCAVCMQAASHGLLDGRHVQQGAQHVRLHALPPHPAVLQHGRRFTSLAPPHKDAGGQAPPPSPPRPPQSPAPQPGAGAPAPPSSGEASGTSSNRRCRARAGPHGRLEVCGRPSAGDRAPAQATHWVLLGAPAGVPAAGGLPAVASARQLAPASRSGAARFRAPLRVLWCARRSAPASAGGPGPAEAAGAAPMRAPSALAGAGAAPPRARPDPECGPRPCARDPAPPARSASSATAPGRCIPTPWRTCAAADAAPEPCAAPGPSASPGAAAAAARLRASSARYSRAAASAAAMAASARARSASRPVQSLKPWSEPSPGHAAADAAPPCAPPPGPCPGWPP